jgi:hypothetical protein
MASNSWRSKKPAAGQTATPVALSYDECLNDFVTTQQWEQEYDSLFDSHNKLEVFYESLAEDPVEEMKRIQMFLGVNYERVQPSTQKQSSQRLAEAIANYDELNKQFAGTSWSTFFSE